MQIQSFQIIPVIDLKLGKVVHAQRGERSHYQPIRSKLCSSSEPLDVVAALLKLYPFRTIYIADIDAICGTAQHDAQIEALSRQYPHISWWVDNGVCNVNARILYAPQPNVRAVLGSELIHNLQDYRAISYAYESRHVLSIDQMDGKNLGAAELHNTGLYWPDDAICMTLNNVGSQLGPDFERLKALQTLNLARKKPAKLYAAGGVRNIEDLLNLEQMGIAGALVASALHSGEITAEQLNHLNQELE